VYIPVPMLFFHFFCSNFTVVLIHILNEEKLKLPPFKLDPICEIENS
jgi:hypothetical protein